MSVLSKRTFGWLGLAVAGVIAGLTPRAHAQELQWIRQFSTSEDDFANELAPDGAGGVLLAGTTKGGLGGGSVGPRNVFLTRYDSEGDQLWIRQFGAGGSNFAGALTRDGAGGVLFAGSTFGSVGGPHAGSWDVFLARYDSAGDRHWIRQFGTSSADLARALAPDGAGGVLLAGDTYGRLGGPNAGGADAFLARFIDAFPLGDLNCDGAFNGADIDPFFQCLGGG